MPVKQRKKENKPERHKGLPKKKPKDSDQLWKIVVAFVVIIGLATAAIYFVGSNNPKDSIKDNDNHSKEKEAKTKKKDDSRGTEKVSRSKKEGKPEKVVKKKAKDSSSSITNKFDKTISKQLADAEKLLENKDIDRAHRTFEKLVKEHPDSPRAMYGLARSLDALADMRRSNQILQQSIDAFGKVANIKDCPSPLKRLAMMRQAERAAFLGRAHVAANILVELTKILPRDVEVWNKLGVQYLMTGGGNSRAKKAFQEALNINPNDGFALVHLGFVVKSESNYKKAVPLFEKGLATGDPGTDDSRFFFHLGDAYYRLGQAKEAYDVYERGAQRGHFLSRMQRSLYNAETPLRAKPFWRPDETPYSKSFRFLEKNWKVIRDEGVSLYDPKKGAFVAEEEGLREKGDWQQFTLFQQGRRDHGACSKAPQTCRLVEKIPEATGCKRGQIKFSVMKPGTHVWAHCGPTNCRIRGHLGLVIPNGVSIRVNETTSTWQEGKFIIIDDSIEHEVWHNGASFRMILIVDFWHPDLTQRQRDDLTPI